MDLGRESQGGKSAIGLAENPENCSYKKLLGAVSRSQQRSLWGSPRCW